MFHDSLKLDRFVLSLHSSWIQAVSSVLELNYEPFRVPHGQVVLRAEVFKRLHKAYQNKQTIIQKSQGCQLPGCDNHACTCMEPCDHLMTTLSQLCD